MAPTNTGPSSGPLPTTTDFNTIYNRIALASAKQASFLTSMRAKYPSLQRPSASSSAAASSAGFSAPSTATTPGAGPTMAQIRAAHEDDAALRFEPINAGLGYRPSKAETETDAATRELGRKLLGKRGREQQRRGQDVRRRVVVEESDDDEGRSGVGRRKRARVVPQAEVRDEEEGDAAGDEDMDDGEPDTTIGVAEVEAEPVVEPPTLTKAVAEMNDGAQSKKKKKKSKNKSKTRAE
ncbi:hypothetical protein HYQ45_002328 [Verticillium longisporum]|nr:Putative sterol O-acyltransferase 2 [Verticillium dahliae VDG2]KAG7140947.1 hypothetical protein HYQ45_002328 [Verticillium longisporum]PNH32701.1 hypothetical protein BJF96_g4125 [Verticillium dahliae]PNH49863.1 hypothetical protein VD0003_g7296 [Verticillium dahliae]PNH62132.1 hypothetical protein VD0002_g5832 [Verticillium dahliae]